MCGQQPLDRVDRAVGDDDLAVDPLEPLARELDARAIAVDLADRSALAAFLEEARDVDVLIANAALPATGRITDSSVEQIDRSLDVNLRAPILLARALAARMAERRSGHIVFINSLAGKAASPRSSLYCATKFGLRGFAQSLREDLRGSGVGVSTVFPGFIRDAGMFADSGAKLPPGVGTRTPPDVAAAVVRAIEQDEGEIDVAPFGLRVGAKVAGVAPGMSATLQRWLGAEKIAEDVTRGQRGKT
ncbi:MAG: SDR family NAD(P)-dependent oxidoreductase [Candidatus Binatia bacterium]